MKLSITIDLTPSQRRALEKRLSDGGLLDRDEAEEWCRKQLTFILNTLGGFDRCRQVLIPATSTQSGVECELETGHAGLHRKDFTRRGGVSW